MNNSSFFDFNECLLSNELFSYFINKFGIFKAKLAVRQAFDLQRMQGSSCTLPVLIIETCGTALVNSQIVKTHIGLRSVEKGMILIYSNKLKAIQLLRDNLD
tara:strand:- start:5509 stop:5814 length:306 start_codon:yes stop_codon:yes gene_type:complete